MHTTSIPEDSPIDIDARSAKEDAEWRDIFAKGGWTFAPRKPNRLGRIAVSNRGVHRVGSNSAVTQLEVFKYVMGMYVTRVAVDINNKVVYCVSGRYYHLAASVWISGEMPEE